jgi:hypothetical protein
MSWASLARFKSCEALPTMRLKLSAPGISGKIAF